MSEGRHRKTHATPWLEKCLIWICCSKLSNPGSESRNLVKGQGMSKYTNAFGYNLFPALFIYVELNRPLSPVPLHYCNWVGPLGPQHQAQSTNTPFMHALTLNASLRACAPGFWYKRTCLTLSLLICQLVLGSGTSLSQEFFTRTYQCILLDLFIDITRLPNWTVIQAHCRNLVNELPCSLQYCPFNE